MFKEPYCTIEEADEVNLSATWIALYDDEKEVALKWGRVYLDSKYKCSSTLTADQESDALEAKKLANALLGEQYALGNMFKPSPNIDSALTEKAVKAGSVSISKKYSEGSGTFDPFPQVTDVLSGYCSYSSATFRNVNVVRA